MKGEEGIQVEAQSAFGAPEGSVGQRPREGKPRGCAWAGGRDDTAESRLCGPRGSLSPQQGGTARQC